jgi:hypothetical protein
MEPTEERPALLCQGFLGQLARRIYIRLSRDIETECTIRMSVLSDWQIRYVITLIQPPKVVPHLRVVSRLDFPLTIN